MKPYVKTALVVGGLIIIWHTIIVVFHVPEYVLPKPHVVAVSVFVNRKELLSHTVITLVEALCGFAIANVTAIALAIAMLFFRDLDKAILPLAIGLKTTPIIAMAPILLLWFGNGFWMKVVAAGLICFFPALVNTTTGLHSIAEGELDLFRVYGASTTQILLKLRLPRALPSIFDALKISSSLSIVGAIVGEFVGANRGIGYFILISSYHLETVKMFASLLYIAAAGVLVYAAVALTANQAVDWAVESAKRLGSPSGGSTPAQMSLRFRAAAAR